MNELLQSNSLSVPLELDKLLEEYNGSKVEETPYIEKLISYNGYYSLDTVPGAFFSIDTKEICLNKQITQKSKKIKLSIVTISFSLDGKTSQEYKINNHVSFQNNVLTIQNVLQITFAREFENGKLTTIYGEINGSKITGYTYFNPVDLSVFCGNYINTKNNRIDLSITHKNNFIDVMYRVNDSLVSIPLYTYNTAMYVLQFHNLDITYTLMLGTAAKNGLACSVTSTQNNDQSFLLTII
ncbi:hypothetical protein P3875_03430 [Myroides sp. JBRI-B21084]|uniref:hypothetical protein n=1 Tax=Myroides sp. JBRI-B21084 TaxID=3119977 RepID=UPI0026E2BE30|nr:hypothetical protein [Paenimyroides cloacae]WKW47123.1 hypothetical protein P3875_03430 [Paenimyroides cloacae]